MYEFLTFSYELKILTTVSNINDLKQTHNMLKLNLLNFDETS